MNKDNMIKLGENLIEIHNNLCCANYSYKEIFSQFDKVVDLSEHESLFLTFNSFEVTNKALESIINDLSKISAGILSKSLKQE